MKNFILASIAFLSSCSLSAASDQRWPYVNVPTKVKRVLKDSVNAQTPPLYLAIERKDYFSIKYLLEHGVDPHLLIQSERYESSAVFEAVRTKNIKIISLFYEYGADLNAACFAGYEGGLRFELTPLEAAIQLADGNETTEVVDFILSRVAKFP